MKYLCAADPAAFDTFLDARLAEHNERERNPAYRYERVPADDGITAVRIYRGRDYDLLAVMETTVEDGYLALNVQMEDIPACVSRRAEHTGAADATDDVSADATDSMTDSATDDAAAETTWGADRVSLTAKIAAYLTKPLVLSAFLWGAVWGISYLLGNRNPWLPLIAPAAYLLFFAVTRCIQYRPRDAKGNFAAFLEHDLAATPCLAEEPSDEDGEEKGEDTAETDAAGEDAERSGDTDRGDGESAGAVPDDDDTTEA